MRPFLKKKRSKSLKRLISLNDFHRIVLYINGNNNFVGLVIVAFQNLYCRDRERVRENHCIS